MHRVWKLRLTGMAGGAVNGIFGGGGGMALIPLLTLWCGVEQRRAFANRRFGRHIPCNDG